MQIEANFASLEQDYQNLKEQLLRMRSDRKILVLVTLTTFLISSVYYIAY